MLTHTLAHFRISFLRRMLGVCLMCSLFLTPLADACRMLTLVQSEASPQRIEDYFKNDSRSLFFQAHHTEPFYQTAGQSLNTNMVKGIVPTVDGVGLAGFNASGDFLPSLYFRDARPLYEAESDYDNALEPLKTQAFVLMGHVRAKTRGEVTEANNHPFAAKLYDGAGGTYAFMANGGTGISDDDYKRLVKDTRLLNARSTAPTMTDSEKLFHVLMQPLLPIIDESKQPGGGVNSGKLDLVAGLLAQTYGDIQGKLSPSVMKPFVKGGGYEEAGARQVFSPESYFLRYTPKTWVMSNGQFTFVFVHGYEQWYQVHYRDNTPVAIAFASEPTNIKEFYTNQEQYPEGVTRWQQLPQDSLTVVSSNGFRVQMQLYPVVIKQQNLPNVQRYTPRFNLKGKRLLPESGVPMRPEETPSLDCRC